MGAVNALASGLAHIWQLLAFIKVSGWLNINLDSSLRLLVFVDNFYSTLSNVNLRLAA